MILFLLLIFPFEMMRVTIFLRHGDEVMSEEELDRFLTKEEVSDSP